MRGISMKDMRELYKKYASIAQGADLDLLVEGKLESVRRNLEKASIN